MKTWPHGAMDRPCRAFFCASLALTAVLSGCASESFDPVPTDPEHVPEEVLSATAIAAEFTLQGEYLVSPVLDAPTGATRVGALVTLVARGSPAVALEARGTGGTWRPLTTTFFEGDQLVARAELGLVARGAQIRFRASELGRIASLTWSAVVPANEVSAPAGDIAAARQPLLAELAAAGVVARETWGARATQCATTDTKYRMAIHHTATPAGGDTAASLRGIQSYHMDTRGWCDIGYHFLVSLDGRVWEGRSVQYLGAHVGGSNDGNIGVSFIGCFHTSNCMDYTPFTPPDVMLDGGANILRILSGIYAISVDANNVLGHRDHPSQTTACPGDNLYALLDELRARANAPVAAAYAATLIAQSFPPASATLTLTPGEEVSGYYELQNIGTETWTPNATDLATTEPRDSPSVLAAADWLLESRPATIDRVVAPGESGRFVFTVRAPLTPGEYVQFFNLVQDGVAWFGDPDQGGPADDQIQLNVTVAPAGMRDAGTSVDDAGLEVSLDGGDLNRRPRAIEGCGCRVARPRSPSPLMLLVPALFFVLVRRRR